jgi:hypothetical protein
MFVGQIGDGTWRYCFSFLDGCSVTIMRDLNSGCPITHISRSLILPTGTHLIEPVEIANASMETISTFWIFATDFPFFVLTPGSG